MSSENLAELIGKAETTLAESVTAAREEFRKGVDTLTADQREKFDKFEADIADAAAEVSKLAAAAKQETEKREELEVKLVELARRGVSVGDDNGEMLAKRVSLTKSRAEMAGKPTRIYGDETDGELATAEDVRAAEAAFHRYIAGGQADFGKLEGKRPDHTFAVGSGIFNPSYGIVVPAHMSGRIIGELYTYGSLRGLALQRTGVQGDSVKLMRFTGKTTVRVGDEVTDWSPGNLPKGYGIEYPISDWSSTVSLHRNTLEDSAFDVQGFLRGEATMALGETEAEYHVTGDGVGKPVGITTLAKTDVDATGDVAGEAAFGTVKAVKTGAAGAVGHGTASNDAFGFNPAIAAVNGLHSRYRMNSTWLMSRTAYARFAMVRDADGNYLMPMSEQLVREGGGLSLVQRPVRINDHMPALANNAYFAAIADWMQAYEIADRSRAMFALVDPYTDKPNVEITLARRSGGRPADTRAIRFLKASA